MEIFSSGCVLKPGRQPTARLKNPGSAVASRNLKVAGLLMTRLIRDLIRPYRWTLVIVFLAMVMETAMSLAGPWPLKIVLDNVVGSHHLHGWLASLVLHVAGGAGKMRIA